MSKRLLLAVMIIGLFGLFFSINAAEATIVNATIINVTGSAGAQNVFYSTSANAYIDGAGNTPDVKLRICATTSAELTSKDVSLAYAVGVDSAADIRVATVAGDASDDFVALNAPFAFGAIFCADTPNDFNILSANAKYPARVYAIIDDGDSTADFGDTFVFVGDNGTLPGNYSFSLSAVQASYSQSTGNITLTLSGATADVGDGTGATVAGSTNNLAVGVCDNPDGTSCDGTNQTTKSSTNSLFTGVTTPADTTTTTNKELMINGFNFTFCIGPDLTVTDVSVSPSTAFQGQNVTINATIQNGNNVDVTTNFNVEFFNDTTSLGTTAVTEDLSPGETTFAVFTFDTSGVTSGDKNITAQVSDTVAGIADCDDTNDNSTTTLSIVASYNITVYINNTIGTEFNRPGRPYNVSVEVDDSDGNDAADVTVKLTERNGLNLFAPVQGFDTDKGVQSVSTAEVATNASGIANLAVIPTGNKLFLPEFAGEDAEDFLGNYSLYIELFNGTEELQLYDPVAGETIDQYNLSLANLTVLDPSAAEENTIVVYNQQKWLVTVLEFFAQVFGNAQKWTNGTAPSP